MLLIDAIYIHESGGKVLLEYLLQQLIQDKRQFYVLFDRRIKTTLTNLLSENNYIFLSPSEKNRKIFYQKNSNRFRSVLCFANVPPPVYSNKLNVYIYFHNLVLLSAWNENNSYSLSSKLLILLKRFYIQWKNQAGYNWLVQSNRMKQAVHTRLNVPLQSIQIFPFFPEIGTPEKLDRTDIQFIYVANGVPQKNHATLLKAWEYIFIKYGLSPILHLTLDNRYEDLIIQIEILQARGIKIVNHGVVSKDELNQLYRKCSYLIFPSLAESFGLPLIEAVQHGCGVLASNLPFVTDVIEPSARFNPYDYIEIGNSVADVFKRINLTKARIKVNNQINTLIHEINTPF